MSLVKDVFEEEERSSSRNMSPNSPIFNEFFEIENTLSEEIANTWEGVMSIDERERALK